MYLYYLCWMNIIIILMYSDSRLYWCLGYVCEGIFALRMNIAVASPYLVGRGVTSWYQSLGSPIFSITSQHIKMRLICSCSAWVLVIHSNHKYIVIYSFLIICSMISTTLPSCHYLVSRYPDLSYSKLIIFSYYLYFILLWSSTLILSLFVSPL